ncbi:D-arabinono-1,4-lactone oxidase [Ruania zhangjianzhongii]|uniref:D-arabinono-1,4-lactone oxidase n=1 Tax=Ruania zhangjianzhongii TaxID=2603206 RepID=UPI0011CC51B6|nr:D-arabinono-1,4-lactone oxidase [Ruania zhangjianzhongii]
MRTQTEPEPLWQNWARTARADPRLFAAPGSQEEVAQLVRAEAERGGQVRVAGAGHSFSPAAVSDGVLLQLDNLDELEWVGPPESDGSRLVRVGAGIRLRRLCRLLAQHGLALENMGDIDAQSVAGAISTGTHGTGAQLRGLADQVRAVRLVTATGQVLDADADQNRDLFEVARLGLGSVGVLTAVTLRGVPAFTLTADERPRPLGAVLEALDDDDGPVWGNDHFEFYWFPYTDIAFTKANNRAGDAPPLHPVRRFFDDEIVANGLFELTNLLCTAGRPFTRGANFVAARALSARRYSGSSAEVFTSPRRVRFREMEYAIPAEAVVPALLAVDSWLRRTREPVPFPIEVRFAAPDEVWLSTAQGRQTAYVAVHQYHRLAFARYFRAVEDIMRAHEGRPHWGKMHRRHAADLAPVYPQFEQAAQVRRAADPEGLFANDYTDRVLGPAAQR